MQEYAKSVTPEVMKRGKLAFDEYASELGEKVRILVVSRMVDLLLTAVRSGRRTHAETVGIQREMAFLTRPRRFLQVIH